MSQLAKSIVAFETGRKLTDVAPMSTFNSEQSVKEFPDKIAREYRLEVRLVASTLVDEAVVDNFNTEPDIFKDAIRVARRKIIEDVFGEFRPLIFQISEEIHNRDWGKAAHLTGKLYHKMFEEGL